MYISEFELMTLNLMHDAKISNIYIKIKDMPSWAGGQTRGTISGGNWIATGVVFNENYVKVIDRTQARHVILHELAHVNVYPLPESKMVGFNPHGPEWVAECRKLGVKAIARAKKWPLKLEVENGQAYSVSYPSRLSPLWTCEREF